MPDKLEQVPKKPAPAEQRPTAPAEPKTSAPAEQKTPAPAEQKRTAPRRATGADCAAPTRAPERPAPAEARPRRRQARGERRIAQLLQAAAAVFCRAGYTAASTNAIAREAGVSPGTLYQFFPNKEAIAVGLSGRLLQQWRETHGQALASANTDLPLRELLDAVLDPLIAFNVENPAFGVLMNGPDAPGPITQECDILHEAVLTRVEEIVAGHLPDAPPDELTRTATMVSALFKAGLELVMSHEDAERDAYIAELKTVMYRYLQPLLDEPTG